MGKCTQTIALILTIIDVGNDYCVLWNSVHTKLILETKAEKISNNNLYTF